MALDITTLLKAATRGAAGYQSGRLAREDAERQARNDLIRQRLLEAQIQNLEAAARQRQQQVEQEARAQELSGLEAGRQEAFRSELAQDYASRFPEAVPQGLHPEIAIARGQGAAESAAAAAERQQRLEEIAARGAQQRITAATRPGTTRPPTTEQNKQADYGTRILEADVAMRELEARYPGIGQRVDAKIRPILAGEQFGRVGKFGARLIAPVIAGAMTPEEQEYWNHVQSLGNAALRRATGAQINDQEYEREVRPLVPLAGEGRGVVAGKQERRRQLARLALRNAGSAFDPSILSPAAQAALRSFFESEDTDISAQEIEQGRDEEEDVLTPYLPPPRNR